MISIGVRLDALFITAIVSCIVGVYLTNTAPQPNNNYYAVWPGTTHIEEDEAVSDE